MNMSRTFRNLYPTTKCESDTKQVHDCIRLNMSSYRLYHARTIICILLKEPIGRLHS